MRSIDWSFMNFLYPSEFKEILQNSVLVENLYKSPEEHLQINPCKNMAYILCRDFILQRLSMHRQHLSYRFLNLGYEIPYGSSLEKRSRIFLPIIGMLLMFNSCDPAHKGNSYINNESTYELVLTYNSYSPHFDSSIYIPANSRVSFFKFDGLGAGKDFDCCLCEFESITLQPTDSSKHLVKIIGSKNNWMLGNPNNRRMDNKDISCEFSVTENDIE